MSALTLTETCTQMFAVTITMAFASSLRAACNPILGFVIMLKWIDDNFDDE